MPVSSGFIIPRIIAGGGLTLSSYVDTTFVQSAGTTKTVSVTYATGDTLLFFGVTEDNGVTLVPSGGGLTYTQVAVINVGNTCKVYLWKPTLGAGQTYTLTATANSSNRGFGIGVYRFSGVTNTGTPGTQTDGAASASLALTTTQANSWIVGMWGDWTAQAIGSRTWRTINSITPTSGNGLEKAAFANTQLGGYSGYWNGVGATGSKTTGLSAPGAGKFTGIAVEVW